MFLTRESTPIFGRFFVYFGNTRDRGDLSFHPAQFHLKCLGTWEKRVIQEVAAVVSRVGNIED